VGQPNTLVPEQAFEDRAYVVRAAELGFDLGSAAAEPKNDEIADRRSAASLAVDRDWNAALEERLAHQQLPAPGELGYKRFH
jgi:hypothetical protein